MTENLKRDPAAQPQPSEGSAASEPDAGNSTAKGRIVYKPITRLGLAALEYWLKARKEGRPVDDTFLTLGLDGSSIREAEVQTDRTDGSQMVAFRLVTDQGADQPRYADVETFAYMRGLLAGGGSFRLSPDTPIGNTTESPRYYVEFSTGAMKASITLTRLAGNALPGEEVSQRDRDDPKLGHRDYRILNLYKSAVTPTIERPRPKQRTKHGRAEAERRAVKRYEARHAKAKLWLSRREYTRMLRDLASLIPPVKDR